MIQDVRFGAKLLRKDWVFTLTAIATLAVCVGGNTVCLPMAAKLTIGGFAVQALAGSAWT